MSWKSVKMVDVCDFQGGTQPPKSEWSTEKINGYVRMIQIRDFTQGKDKFVEYVKDSPTLKKCASDDIMIGRYGASIGKILTGLEGAYNVALVKTIPSDTLHKGYFYHYLNSPDFQSFIQNAGSRAAQAGFNKEELKDHEIPLPPLPIQKRIAEILDAADALRRKDQELLRKYDELAQAIFIDMFGDPVKNEKGWEVKKLKEFGKVQTGNTPPREEKRFYGSFIEWIKTDNILLEKLNPLQATEYLSEEGLKKGRYVDSGSVLVTCIAGSSKSIGNVVLTNRRVSFNQQINSLTPKSSYNKLFIYALFRYSKSIIQDNTTQGMKRIITKSTFENLKFISPPIELQNEFEQKYKVLLKLIDSINFQQKSSENLFDSLLQQAFKGELVK